MQRINIFWHRRDLRIQDNAGLYYALADGLPVLPVFIFDKNILESLTANDDGRVTFIHDQITILDKHYQTESGGLKVFFDSPERAFRSLLNEFEVNAVFTNRDYEPYANERDSRICSFLKENNVGFFTFKDQVIFEKGEILNDQGEPYKVFTPYKNKWLDRFKKVTFLQFQNESLIEGALLNQNFEIPSLEDLGFSRSALVFPSTEIKKDIIENYGERRDFPAQDATSRLGVHLRFGTISIRECVKKANQMSDVWLSELIWREFYMMILAHFPEVVDRAFKPQYDLVPWINDENKFNAWCEGRTGYPIVDAGMRELNATGYMHNRVRMIVASFLTKHLLIDWRWGERYFAQKLLDFELSSNNGGWQWAAGTGTDAQPYFRVFNPYSQQEKFDKNMVYIRKWVPEWNTSSYSKPIVEHKYARQRAIDTYKAALSADT